MFLLRIALGLALMAPCLGLAQPADAPALSPPTNPDTLPPPPLVSAPKEPEAPHPPAVLFPHQWKPSEPQGPGLVAGRLMLELLAGAAGGAGMGAVSFLVGASVISGACDGDSLDCFVPLFMMGGAGALIGVPLGVYGAGKLMKGRGQFWPTLIGTVAGAGLGLAGALASQNGTALILGLSAGPVVGAIVGYEISHLVPGFPTRPGTVRPGLGLSMLPSFAATPGGGVLGGLSGRF
ncbi:hypothetical protein [Stigmatella aurantiaca]|uniref:Elastin n=1 Tax=Stigmatella aurantiaca (strain DW4/3-1) TaxID=378806 RepID=Q09C41_STIAD|nr:hypothetical protein [Stigmatella aurantiaca]ADO74368.1 uncharacterized protein STAUR_6611 [Stigmatella aurantiaca DW4/3-1]EAU69241.1 hypothetical protein STIAU_7996 [Stigmatella aurantiaca DW4/3-1]